MKHIVAFGIGIVLCLGLLFLGHPWIALVAMVGPFLAWSLSILGVTGAAIMTYLSGGGSIPIVAGVFFLITIALAIASFFI